MKGLSPKFDKPAKEIQTLIPVNKGRVAPYCIATTRISRGEQVATNNCHDNEIRLIVKLHSVYNRKFRVLFFFLAKLRKFRVTTDF